MLIVRTTPLERPGVPAGLTAVQNRVNEITFGAALRQELRSLGLVKRALADAPSLPEPLARLRDARVHMIGAEEEFQALHGGSGQDPTWGFLSGMRQLGHAAAERWLGENLPAIGCSSTLDLAPFAGPMIEGRLATQDADVGSAFTRNGQEPAFVGRRSPVWRQAQHRPSWGW